MRKLTVQLQRSPGDSIVVGLLAEADQRVYFEYDVEFLQKAIQLSPFKVPARAGLIEHVDRSFGALPGLFDDSLPDGWGLLLMDRMFRRRGVDPAEVSPLERLAYLGKRTMGALTYHPPADVERDERLLDLHEMGRNAQQIYRGDAVDVLPELMRAGGSPAGARPKVLVGVKGDQIISGEDDLPAGFSHWIIKFSATDDVRDAGPLEFAYSNMARAAGIDMPQTKLFRVRTPQVYFGAQRFDRGPRNHRLHLHTFGNLIHSNFRIPSTDYADLIKVTLALTRNQQDVRRVFRRMAFNVAAHNRDDHAKNFSYIMNDSGEWSLSPAYDLTFAPGPGGEHTMTVAGEGRAPKREHLLHIAKGAGIKPKYAVEVLDEVNSAIDEWSRFADEAGATKKRMREVRSHLRQL